MLVVSDAPLMTDQLARLMGNPGLPETPVVGALLPNGGAVSPDGRTEIEPVEFTIAPNGDQGATMIEAAVKMVQPFAAVIVDWRVFLGRDCSPALKRMWAAQSDLHVVVHAIFDPETRGRTAQKLGVSHRLVLLKHEMSAFEIARMAQTMAVKWKGERQLSLVQAQLNMVQTRPGRVEASTEAPKPQTAFTASSTPKGDSRQMNRLEIMGRLTEGVAHGFNNFLTVIQGLLTVGLNDKANPEMLAACIEEVLKEVKKASESTGQLLEFNHREPSDPQAVDLAKALEEEISVLRRVLGEQVTIEVDHEEDLPPVLADPASLAQVMANLSVRARDAMPQGGKLSIHTRRIHVPNEMAAGLLHSEAKPGDFVAVAVADGGDTLSAEEIARVFDPGAQDTSASSASMSLVWVQELIRQQGGWTSVTSVPEVGTEFTFHLPVAKIGAVVQPLPKRVEPTKVEDKPSSETSTILVVDDEDAVRQVMEFVLANQGHTVITAKDANEAWTLWSKHSRSINLAIVDIKLPGGISGFDLERAISEEDCTVPVIFTCGCHPSPADQKKPLKVGVNYLPKPFGMAELISIVNKAVLQPAKF